MHKINGQCLTLMLLQIPLGTLAAGHGELNRSGKFWAVWLKHLN